LFIVKGKGSVMDRYHQAPMTARVVNKIRTLAHMKRVSSSLDSHPILLQLDPTSTCNLSCPMCRRNKSSNLGNMLSFEDYTRILERFPWLDFLLLIGIGEPLLNERLFDFIAYAEDADVRIMMATNATLIDASMAGRLVDSRLGYLQLSFDGGTKETYEATKKGADFDQVVENITVLMRKKKESRSRMKVFLVTVVTGLNYREVPRLMGLADQMGVDTVLVTPDLCNPTIYPDYDCPKVPEKELLATLKEVRALGRKRGITTYMSSTKPHGRFRSRGTTSCYWPWYGMYVTCEGDVTPCSEISDPEWLGDLKLGNVFETPVEEIWNGPAYQEFRRRLASSDPVDFCAHCLWRKGMFVPLRHPVADDRINRAIRWMVQI